MLSKYSPYLPNPCYSSHSLFKPSLFTFLLPTYVDYIAKYQLLKHPDLPRVYVTLIRIVDTNGFQRFHMTSDLRPLLSPLDDARGCLIGQGSLHLLHTDHIDQFIDGL